ncbi:MAG TPA: hypothetical protein VKT28_16675 [Puia sp.]|nr:hypothetical protein [Puia sp.]
MNNENLLIETLRKDLEIELAEKISFEEIRKKLEAHINHLINHDFEKLVSLLYRIDVSESKLKNLLNENKNANAGNLIAELIIERQLQKIRTRAEHKKDDNSFDEEEKW